MQPVKLFYSYSHEDEALRKQLNNHLAILKREGYISEWHDRMITAGSEWAGEINNHLENSDIILFLVSSDFLASDYCQDVEIKKALELREEGEAEVIPVILRDCVWQIAEFSKLQAIPTNGNAITGEHWHNHDTAFKIVADEIKKKIDEINTRKNIVENISITQQYIPENKLKQYPKPKVYFAGREDKLQELREAYRAHAFILIEGAGGIGKTQIVAKFIQEEGIGENVVWYECHPTSQPDDVIRGAGFGDLLKGDHKTEREKHSAFKDKIEEYGYTIFLDNYQDIHHENKNFPALLEFIDQYLHKGHFIIIDRDNIVSPSLHPKKIHVPGLGEQSILHAKQLIDNTYRDELGGISDDILITICDTFQGYPLAIDLAINLLSQNVPIQEIVDEAVTEAETPSERNETISERLLNKIFTREDATKEEKEFLKTFSVFRGKINEEAVKSVMPDDVFKVGVRKLKLKNILAIDGHSYELHPLIREFCYKHLYDKIEIHLKAALHYKSLREKILNPELEEKIYYHLSNAGEWNEIAEIIEGKGREFIMQGYLDRVYEMISSVRNNNINRERFTLLEGDILFVKGELKLAGSLFQETMNSKDELINIESNLKHGEALFERGETLLAGEIFDILINHSSIQEHKNLYARVLYNSANLHKLFGRTQQALEMLYKSLEIREEINEREDIASTLLAIAIIKKFIGYSSEAIALCSKSIEISKANNDKIGYADALLILGSMKADMGYYKEALLLFYDSLGIKKDIGNKSGIAMCLNEIAVARHQIDGSDIALEFYVEALEINKEIGDKRSIAASISNIGGIYLDDFKYDEACKLFNESLLISKETGDKQSIAVTLSNLGLANRKMGETNEALRLYYESFDIRKEIGDKCDISGTLNNIAYVKKMSGNVKEALKLYYECLEICTEIDDKAGVANALRNIAIIKGESGHTNEALRLIEESLRMFREIEFKRDTAAALNIYAAIKHNSDKSNPEGLINESLEIFKEIGQRDGIASCLHSLADHNFEVGKHDIALEMYYQAAEIYKDIKDLNELANCLLSVSQVLFYKKSNYTDAIDTLITCIALCKKIGSNENNHQQYLYDYKTKLKPELFRELVNSAYQKLEHNLKSCIDLSILLPLPRKGEVKVGRNDPCPCGNGKKYKQCHGK